MNSTRQTASVQQTPEQLMKLLELELCRSRARKEKASGDRAKKLIAGVVTIVVGAGLALLLLQYLLTDLRARGVTGPEVRGAEEAPLLITE